MARRRGLPQGTLETLIDETHDADLRGPAVVVRAREARAGRGERMGRGPSSKRRARKAVRPDAASRATRRTLAPEPRGAAALWASDPVSRYAAARGLPVVSGALPSIRLAFQYAMDVREVARRERTNVLAVVSKALAGYLTAYERL